MGREELNDLIKQGPVRLKMNNGDVIENPSSEVAVVSDWHITVLVLRDSGRLGTRLVSLANINTADPNPV